LKGGRGERADERAVTLWAFALGLGAEWLDLFKAMAALRAAVFIQRQGDLPLGEERGLLNLL
jgi:hypothetical protein